ncbi:hypothetical protein OOZ63_06315 [Paucibacter sp. PLA-PC-4]|uniref:hypothetical protein n=1 Tax=Paucibacter sp. PLA-PC-4 TaxID=2993655 RepID=UPI002249999D|nr:hypothetical protein [Paucibacter sp. PLA-PC-4]MCX2861450.1 hypothetical protein [Paucibacter sp. PLA-PC-4]
MTSVLSYMATCLLAGATLSAVAQARPDPTDPRAEVPAARHQSALQHYKPLSETEPADWRDANRRVQQAGGWRAYAREAAASAPAHKH